MQRLISLIVLFLAACGLTRPLSSDGFEMTVDQEALSRKKEYLAQPEQAKEDAPNIIWIIIDDLGMFDSDLYGEGTVNTPGINKLADEGVMFTNAYVTSPVCGPSRAAIYTGRYNQRFGFEHQQHDRYLNSKFEYLSTKLFVNSKPWHLQKQDSVPNEKFMASVGLPKSEITIAEVLKKHGYRTGLFGKWHLSYQRSEGPNAFGFDEFYGFMNSHSLFASEDDPDVVSIHNKKDWTDKYIWKDGREGLSAIERNGQIINEDRYLTEAITEEALAFINDSEQPFFAVLSYNAPHTPFQAKKEAYDRFYHIKDPVKRTYAAMIYSLDQEISKLHEYLVQTNQLDNTLICFISDNGGAAYTHATDNGGYKGGKITTFEGGLRVPMFISWPGKMAAGDRYELPVSSLDLFKTTLNAVSKNAYPRDVDGTDLVLAVSENKMAHKYLYFRKGHNRGVRTPDYKLMWSTQTPDTLLYDIHSDQFERQDIFGHVNVEEKAAMFRAYSNWQREMMEPSWPPVINYRFKDEDGRVYWFEN